MAAQLTSSSTTAGVLTRASAAKARRESVVPIGVSLECDASLLVHDDSFFGDEYAGESSADSDSADEESAYGSPVRKRIDLGHSVSASPPPLEGEDSSASDFDGDETMDIEPLNEFLLSLPDQDDDEIASALIASEVRDWKKIGCGCKKSNCYASLDADKLECLLAATRKLRKRDKKQYIVGQLSASMRATAKTARH